MSSTQSLHGKTLPNKALLRVILISKLQVHVLIAVNQLFRHLFITVLFWVVTVTVVAQHDSDRIQKKVFPAKISLGIFALGTSKHQWQKILELITYQFGILIISKLAFVGTKPKYKRPLLTIRDGYLSAARNKSQHKSSSNRIYLLHNVN